MCGHTPPTLPTGLDRLDSSVRVYTEASCVSCCGDCNVMKYTHSEHFFLAHVEKVANHNVGVESWPGAAAEEEEAGGEEEGEQAVSGGPAGEAGGDGSDGGDGPRGEGGGEGSGASQGTSASASKRAKPAAPPEPEKEERPNPFAAFAFGS